MRVNLKQLRYAKRLRQRDVAERAGITTRYYKSLENGSVNGSICVWEKLRDILGAESIDYLLVQDDQ